MEGTWEGGGGGSAELRQMGRDRRVGGGYFAGA